MVWKQVDLCCFVAWDVALTLISTNWLNYRFAGINKRSVDFCSCPRRLHCTAPGKSCKVDITGGWLFATFFFNLPQLWVVLYPARFTTRETWNEGYSFIQTELWSKLPRSSLYNWMQPFFECSGIISMTETFYQLWKNQTLMKMKQNPMKSKVGLIQIVQRNKVSVFILNLRGLSSAVIHILAKSCPFVCTATTLFNVDDDSLRIKSMLIYRQVYVPNSCIPYLLKPRV